MTGPSILPTTIGLSQGDLAHRAELNPGYLNGIERFDRNSTVIVLQRLAVALGTTPADLLAGPELITKIASDKET